MAQPVPIREHPAEPTYKASDIVTAIGLAVDVGGGKMTLQSHVLNVDGIGALKSELDKLTEAADWVSAKYGLRNLRLQLEQEEKAIVDFRTQKSNELSKIETEWTEIQKKRGDVRLTESQRNLMSRYDNSIESRRTVIEKIRKDIAITEAILNGAK